jgi:hypothetical protein
MSANERTQIDKRLPVLNAEIKAKQAELARMQSGWCEDRFKTIHLAQEIGALQREWTTLAQRQAALVSVDETSTRSSQVFIGSQF